VGKNSYTQQLPLMLRLPLYTERWLQFLVYRLTVIPAAALNGTAAASAFPKATPSTLLASELLLKSETGKRQFLLLKLAAAVRTNVPGFTTTGCPVGT